MKRFKKRMSLALLISLVISLFIPVMGYANETSVNLETADGFAVLAGSAISNTGETIIYGDVGLDPGTAFTGQETVTMNDGTIYIDDAVALQAKNDLLDAYIDAADRTSVTISSEMGGSVLTPGVYSSASSLQITGTLIIDGQNDPNAVFIIQAGTTLTTASNSKVELINGANAKNIFWQVGSSATLGISSEFVGSILSSESITATSGAKIEGQLLALNGAVTLDNNTIRTFRDGSLTVEKIVTGDIGDMTLPVFEITVTGPEDFSSTRTFTNNESYTWENLIPGEYEVSENRASLIEESTYTGGWTVGGEWTVSGEGTIEVVANEVSLLTITNSYIAPTHDSSDDPTDDATDDSDIAFGLLSIQKIVAGDIGDMTLPVFEITVTGPEDFSSTRTFTSSETYIWENLVPGEYEVTENRNGLSSAWMINGEGTIQVVANEVRLITITNLYSPSTDVPTDESDIAFGLLSIEKIVAGDIGAMTLPVFEITVTGPQDFSSTRTFTSNETYTWENLVPGEYKITENRTSLSDDWTVSGEVTVLVVANELERVTIENYYEKTEAIPETGQKTNENMTMLYGSIALIMASVGLLLGNKKHKING